MTWQGRIKETLKVVRASQPLNYIAATTLRGVSTAIGVKSEFIIKHLPRVGVVESSLPNGRVLRLLSRGDEWVPNQVFWRGWSGYEPESLPLFFRFAERSRVVLDIGAHIGVYALIAGLANAEAKVFAFEPLVETCLRLRENVALNKLNNVTCFEMAISDVDGIAKFYRPEGAIPCSAGMSSDFYSPWADSFSAIDVNSITGDRFVSENGIERVDLVKIDTESTEPQVLRGLKETITRDRPVIFCEVLRGCVNESEIEELLAPLGYQFYLLTGEGTERRDHIEGHPEYLNYLFSTFNPQND